MKMFTYAVAEVERIPLRGKSGLTMVLTVGTLTMIRNGKTLVFKALVSASIP